MKWPLLAGFILIHSWYPQPCCGDFHCHPVPCDELIEGEGGNWTYHGVFFDYFRIAPSQDKFCHVCIIGGQGACAFIQMGM